MPIKTERFKFKNEQTNVPVADLDLFKDNSIYSRVRDAVLSESSKGFDLLQRGNGSLGAKSLSLDSLKKSPPANKTLLKEIDNKIQGVIKDEKVPSELRKAISQVESSSPGALSNALLADLQKGLQSNRPGSIKNLSVQANLKQIQRLPNSIVTGSVNKMARSFSKDNLPDTVTQTLAQGLTIPASPIHNSFLNREGNIQSDRYPSLDLGWNSVNFDASMLVVDDLIHYTQVDVKMTDQLQQDFSLDSDLILDIADDSSNAPSDFDMETHLTNKAITTQQKAMLLEGIENKLNNHTPGTPEYDRVNEIRVQVKSASQYSAEKAKLESNYRFLNDRLLSVYQKLVHLDALSTVELDTEIADNSSGPTPQGGVVNSRLGGSGQFLDDDEVYVDNFRNRAISYAIAVRNKLLHDPDYSWIREDRSSRRIGLIIDPDEFGLKDDLLSMDAFGEIDTFKPNELPYTSTAFLISEPGFRSC